MVRDLFKNTGIYFFGSVLSKAITTIAWIALARLLTPEKYGQFTLYFMILQMTTFLGDFGLNQWYLRNVEKENRTLIFNKIIYVRSLTLFLTIAILSFILFYFKIFDLTSSLFLLASLIPMSYLSVTEGYYLEQKKGIKVSLKLISISGIFLFGYMLIYKNLDLQKSVLTLFVSLILTVSWFIPWKQIRLGKFLSLSEIFSILKSSSSYLYLNLTSFFYNKGDSFIISYFKGNSALGIYGLAYRFLESLSLFSTSLTQNLFPLSAKKEGIKLKQLLKISLLMFVSGAFVSIFVYLGANFLVIGLFGLQYSAAIPILRIFAVVLLLFFINAPLATVVQSSYLVKSFLPYGVLNTLLNISLNILLVPKFGIIAAAWMMALTEITGFLINLHFVKKLYF